MTEEVQEVPKWLKELEEKRERRLKARLGHEAGAGAPCLTCEEKCPGLDLHFWRKICKNCKCGKESHDFNDDDVYGWAQFQLLGSRPNKSKKFVLPGRKDAVELDWMPKGVADAVESYLKDLPINLLPIKGSPAALERKQLLQKQIPLHDIDPTLCHALSENEIIKMRDYIADVKQNSVGVGRVVKLNELLIANSAPMQIPQMENIILQGSNRCIDLLPKNLQGLKLNDCKLPERMPNHTLFNETDVQNPVFVKSIQDVKYTRGTVNSSNRPGFTGRYESMPNHQSDDYQNPQHISTNVRDINNHVLTNLNSDNGKSLNNNLLSPNQPVLNEIDNQSPLNLHFRDVEYATSGMQTTFPPCISQSAPNALNGANNGRLVNLLIPNSDFSNSVDHQYATNPGSIKDITYASHGQNSESLSILNGDQHSGGNRLSSTHTDNNVNLQKPQNAENNLINIRFPTNISNTRDVNYLTLHNLSNDGVNSAKPFDKLLNNIQIPNTLTTNQIDNQVPKTFSLNDRSYPTNNLLYPNQESQYSSDNLPDNTKLQTIANPTAFKDIPYGSLQTPMGLIQNVVDQQIPIQTGVLYDVNYPRNSRQPSSINKTQTITNIKDLAYSTYDPQPSSNPDEINATPVSINIGLIKDIEYPTVKSAVQTQSISEPAIPRKNVHFNLVPEEILPSCHKCHKTFDASAVVIGVDRTDSLWHADCFKCAGCNQNLADLMYFYDKSSDDIYCGRDYAKIRGIPRCQACDELIFVKEYCLAENSTFHVKHFCCFECDSPLAGQNYVMEESQPLCLPCFELLKAEKCNTCLKVIKPDEQGANLNGVHFHADDDCFVCKMCKKPLLGAKLLFKNMNLYCSMPCFGADV